MIAVNSYMKYEEIPEIKERFICGFKQIETDKIDNYIILRSESHELNENNELFNFWFTRFINNEKEKKNEDNGIDFYNPGQKKQLFSNSQRMLLNIINQYNPLFYHKFCYLSDCFSPKFHFNCLKEMRTISKTKLLNSN